MTAIQISLGNKTLGLISFVAIIFLVLCFVVPYFRWETLLTAGLVMIIYSFQASRISYISLKEGSFLIERILMRAVRKEAVLFDEVVETIPFTHLMRIKFKDGSSYLFWGKSENELNSLIRNELSDQ